ncbi:hypothetical protein M378DRAFT_182440 [Amanita muscaria Koide BX008]|uniref:Uncharacterized protein n=1 Tax=Amanita muscaria (strain Koide BX008) TaxID=946122 RepID=A0A0C2SLC7_AMAMK|nr:hypothetical protein M378DRAFT_182440 [Amanita muscaria Koide BX008]
MSAQQMEGSYRRPGPQGRPNYVNTQPKPPAAYANTRPDLNYTNATPSYSNYPSNEPTASYYDIQVGFSHSLSAYGFENNGNKDNELILIGNATHEKLMASCNSAYMRIHEERNSIASVLKFIPTRNDDLQKDLLREQVTREVEERHYR